MTNADGDNDHHISLRVLKRVWYATTERNLDLVAAGVAFYAMLAVFPAAAAVIALWGFWFDTAIIESQLDMLSRFIPAEAFSLLQNQTEALIRANSTTLGWTTLVSIAAAFWATRAGVAALIRGVNTVYGTRPRTGFWQVISAFAMTGALIALALTTLFSVVVVPLLLAFLPLGAATGFALSAARWVLVVVVFLTGLGMFYRFGPNVERERPNWISPGAVVALLIWAAASVAFSYYLTNFGAYNRIYGSIGAVIALLMWFFISAYAVLLGAVLNAEIAHCLAAPAIERSPDGPDGNS
ncbi:MAG: YihY/virulence factor BrkB family protein [Rhodobacter sp.]|nr:YihY/virulence factor BrkB family protein [Rhodobacter sp.]